MSKTGSILSQKSALNFLYVDYETFLRRVTVTPQIVYRSDRMHAKVQCLRMSFALKHCSVSQPVAVTIARELLNTQFLVLINDESL